MMGKQSGQIQMIKKAAPYYSHVGRKFIDPVILIKMLLIGYLYRIKSERRLEEEVSLNLA
ncbi:MAG: transposase [Eubacterium sp.]|nr:transposase [Eubacterium sp.]